MLQLHTDTLVFSIAAKVAQGGTWFTFNSLSGAGIIYFCKLKHLEPGGPR